ncbi:hypothetical protein FA13DRAFT_1779591 [Coprinellus micaceus]|uniref:Uncharacterized protein n=1 Tax=Coprinellus micaceus TaxID=71717 RepID=A0A4Y7SGI7_COPMI|nr:hypothetical protein FA13DRAFT_1779591 [Coprinellus micaceus]
MSDDNKNQLRNIIIGCSIAAVVVVVGVIGLGIWVYRRMVRQLASQVLALTSIEAGLIKPLGLGETGRPTAEDIEMGNRLPAYEPPQSYAAPGPVARHRSPAPRPQQSRPSQEGSPHVRP